MRISRRNLALLGVTRDLFLKGSPEFRVASFAYENHFTEQQLRNALLNIQALPEFVLVKIIDNFRDISNKNPLKDDSVLIGNQINNWLKSIPKIEIDDA